MGIEIIFRESNLASLFVFEFTVTLLHTKTHASEAKKEEFNNKTRMHE